jgi:F0F1-type ATP synthase assembly protein I
VDRPEPRSPLAVAVQWASRITTVGLEFALPPLAGVYLDRYWSLRPLATVLGVLIGFAVGMVHILGIAREGKKS